MRHCHPRAPASWPWLVLLWGHTSEARYDQRESGGLEVAWLSWHMSGACRPCWQLEILLCRSPHSGGVMDWWPLSVCLSVPCLTLSWEQKEGSPWHGWPVTPFTYRHLLSEMTYTVSSGTLNPSIPYHTILTDSSKVKLIRSHVKTDSVSKWGPQLVAPPDEWVYKCRCKVSPITLIYCTYTYTCIFLSKFLDLK